MSRGISHTRRVFVVLEPGEGAQLVGGGSHQVSTSVSRIYL
jgi:hypothetical protein